MHNLSDIKEIKYILEKFGFSFSKSLGQNFIVNPGICPKIAESAEIGERDGVLEIGPGIGVLTSELAKKAAKVVAIELDKRLPEILKYTLEDFNNVKIIGADALKIDLRAVIDENFSDCEDVHIILTNIINLLTFILLNYYFICNPGSTYSLYAFHQRLLHINLTTCLIEVIRCNTYNKVITQILCSLQEVIMSLMKEIERSVCNYLFH